MDSAKPRDGSHALAELRDLTECHCPTELLRRGKVSADCLHAYREDVEELAVLLDALLALRARVVAAPVGKLIGSEHSASNLVYRVALHGPKEDGPKLLTLVRLLAVDAGEVDGG